ncbi:dipeptide ABC transporter ATP-binding protein [Citricoccus muralis]|uniref:Peptide/nickel transport system ATP-binding protein n=1 Tax=Citricoccus muralis TaxID=169134 RepID=A0A3D9LIB5_9MICC|nr:ABC transporter ATP-binding protein [Citricoccus muralis]REE04813.1 peptide/nickel transport system ATP-binding protein [Citricoccus muralis]
MTLTTTWPSSPVEGLDEAAASGPIAAEVSGLHLTYVSRQGRTTGVEDVSFAVPRGETVALVGESGSGKSSVVSALAGLLPDNGRIEAGQLTLNGREVTSLTDRQWRPLRGTVLGYVPQDPLGSLDPLMSVGQQIAESVAQARGVGSAEAADAALELLEHVGILDAAHRYRSYPHELSGGQLQRVLIASALAGRPQVLIADEPTSALDVTVQKRILDLLTSLQREFSLTLILVTHDLSLAAERADSVVVLRHGRVVEQGRVDEVLHRPVSEYTRQLFSDVPALNPDKYALRLQESAARRDPAARAISVCGLSRSFVPGVRAVDSVGFEVAAGEIHALVGESGSGKTTIARIVAGLTGFDQGTVEVFGEQLERTPPVVNASPERLQLVYQNPLSALNPRIPVEGLVAEPLRIRGLDRRSALEEARRMLERVGIGRELWRRKASQLSGGQRQRVAISRALVLSPSVLVLDEPTSALDVTVQAQIVDLLFDLREQYGLTFLLISHDLSLIRQVADTVTVLERGALVESGPVRQVFEESTQSYTRALIDAVPHPTREDAR